MFSWDEVACHFPTTKCCFQDQWLRFPAARRAGSSGAGAVWAIPVTSTMWAELVCARNPWATLAPSEMTAKALQADCWEGVPSLSLRFYVLVFLFQVFSVWVQNWHKLGMWWERFLSHASLLSPGCCLETLSLHPGCSPWRLQPPSLPLHSCCRVCSLIWAGDVISHLLFKLLPC